MTNAPSDAPRRELARRPSGSFEIALYWHPPGNRVTIEIHDAATDETLTFPVHSAQALDAFRHPFAYLAEQSAPASVRETVSAS